MEDHNDHDEAEGEDQEPQTPTEPPTSPQKTQVDHALQTTNGTAKGGNEVPGTPGEISSDETREADEMSSASRDPPSNDQGPQENVAIQQTFDTEARLDALAKERDALRQEVAQVRKSLEEIQEKHEEELGDIREQLAGTQGEKEQAETQYRSLLGKVSTIRSQLGERLKADAVSCD